VVSKAKPVRKDLGYYLRVYRAKRDMTQVELAAVLGINPSHLSLIEAGRRFPGRELTRQIRALTGAPVHALLGEEKAS